MGIQTVLFDLDGTIIDTNELIISSFLHALDGKTETPYTRELIIPHMGRPLIDQLKLFSGREQVDDLLQAYFDFNVGKHDEMAVEFPHVKEVIPRLHAAGIRLGVVTTKRRVTAEMGIALLGLKPYMDVVITIDDVIKPKPDPEGVLRALRLLNAEPGASLMVGDSQYDIQAGHNAGIRSAGVAWSMKGETFLNQFQPDYMLQDMKDLLKITGLAEE